MSGTLNNPKFLCPSTNVQDCVVDANLNTITFSCIVDGNEAITEYKISIFSLETNELLLECRKRGNSEDSSVFDANGFFYPVDEKNKNNVLTVTIAVNEKIVNQPEPYYWNIQVTGESGIVATSCDEVFYCNTLPSLQIQYNDDNNKDDNDAFANFVVGSDIVLTSKTCHFKCNYVQENNVPLKRYGWRIINTDTKQILMDTISKNQIYGVAHNIRCSYNGFMDGSTYSIEAFVETQNGQCVTTDPYKFKVSYKTSFLSNDFRVETLSGEPGVILDWSKSVTIEGKANGEVRNIAHFPILGSTTSVHIAENASIVYDYGTTSNFNIDENSYVVLSTQLLSDDDMTLLDMSGTSDNNENIMKRLTYSKGVFYYMVSEHDDITVTAEYKVENSPNQNVWYIIVLHPMDENQNIRITVTESRASNGLYPSENKYPCGEKPSVNDYPYFGVWDKLKENSDAMEAGEE